MPADTGPGRLLIFIYINNIFFNIIEIPKDTNKIFVNIFLILYFIINFFISFI